GVFHYDLSIDTPRDAQRQGLESRWHVYHRLDTADDRHERTPGIAVWRRPRCSLQRHQRAGICLRLEIWRWITRGAVGDQAGNILVRQPANTRPARTWGRSIL